MSEAWEAYGRLSEGLHITGYSVERACENLEWLLVDDRWALGGRFSDVNAFMDSIRLDKFRALAESRKRIAVRIRELQPGLSNRRIAKALGVDEGTIRRDTAAENSAALDERLNENNGPARPAAGNSAPRELSGVQAAKLVERRETAKAERFAKIAADEARVLRLAPIVGKFRTLVVDPGWEWDWLSRAVRARAGYAMQTHAGLLNLNVRRWADETVGCHLYLWVPNNFMARACELMARWGFQHRTVITWVKEGAFAQGSYFRNSTEHVLFGTLGKTTTRPAAASLATHFVAPRGEEHSEKPEAFYDLVRAASYPPHGKANQRTPRPDFVNLFRELEAADSDAEEARHGC
jgi:N6-adenosine-specific RNA methylase IME4